MYSLADTISSRASLTPHRVALVDAERGVRYTYAQLEERANRAAHLLLSLGVGQGDRVGIHARNGVHFSDLLFACAKLGAILVPSNFRLAPPELRYIMEDCEPSAVFFDPEYGGVVEEAASGLAIETLSLGEEYEERLASSPSHPVDTPVDPEETAAILYTSGTTGRPKGAMLPHRMMMWNVFNTVLSWELGSTDVAPIFTPQFHSGGLNVFMLPLLAAGGRLLITRAFDPRAAIDLIEREGATVVFMVPTMFQMLSAEPAFWKTEFRSVRFFVSGGAPCPVELISLYQDRGLCFKQGFGMTEVGVNCFSMTREESIRRRGSVGKPILHTRARVADEEGRELPPGEVGELQIRGPHVFSGYWRNAEATRAAWQDGWFRTGDLARRDEEGFFYIVGRIKEMFISGGENIYPAEVEAAMIRHPAVAEAAVIPVPDARWGEVGRAVVALKPGCQATEAELLEFARSQLAGYKVPKSVVFVPEIPKNEYGKVVRPKLVETYGHHGR